MQERMLRWLDNQIADAVSDIPRKMLPQWSDLATTSQVGDEETEYNYVREG
jgi:hypothetical protein